MGSQQQLSVCQLYHCIYTSNSRECTESLGKPCSCIQFIKSIFYCKSRENPYQYYKSRENLYQVLQVTLIVFEHAVRSKVRRIHLVNHYHHTCSTKILYARKNIIYLLLLALLLVLHIHNNTDGNKLVIFSDIALYGGDTYECRTCETPRPKKIHVPQHAHCRWADTTVLNYPVY